MSVIELKNLYKSYGTKEVLKGIDLQVGSGEIIGYIGPNGAGKSTTVKIMLGLIDDYKGQVLIFGQDIKESDVDYKKRIGYVPESGDVYETLSGDEYLSFLSKLYGLEDTIAKERIEHLARLFGLYEVISARISSYSKGMRQKLLIIASIIHNPDVLFFDEPISGLDANSVMIFKELIQQMAAVGKTIFYSSHIMDVVEKISHRIVLIDQGIIAADGAFDALRAANHNDTLEEVFNNVTGFDNHEATVEAIMATIGG